MLTGVYLCVRTMCPRTTRQDLCGGMSLAACLGLRGLALSTRAC